jgi:hypothetical protein
MLKLREFDTPEEKMKAAELVCAKLIALKKTIPFIREYETGINITQDDSAFDVVINSSFDSKDDLIAYQVHPDHKAFMQFNKNFSIKKTLVDYKY